jgi:hypothetical protein
MGMASEVKIAKDGSGTVAAEYRLSEELVAFGQLEANKDMLPVPLTESDVREGLKGAKGLRFVSWSRKKDGTDTLIKTVVAFDSLKALAGYLDPEGKLARHETSAEGSKLVFSLGSTLPAFDPEMKKVAKEAFSSYSLVFEFDLPSPPKEFSASSPIIKTSRNGNKVRFEGAMGDIVSGETVPGIIIAW